MPQLPRRQRGGVSKISRMATRRLQPTASDSALVVIVAARSIHQRLHRDAPINKLAIYTTAQTHTLGRLKARLILGPPVCTISVHAKDGCCLHGQGFSEMIERDKAEGKHHLWSVSYTCHPMPDKNHISVPVGTIGITSSGAIGL